MRIYLNTHDLLSVRDEPCPFCGAKVSIGMTVTVTIEDRQRVKYSDIHLTHDDPCGGILSAIEILDTWVQWWWIRGYEIRTGPTDEDLVRKARFDDPILEFETRWKQAAEAAEDARVSLERARSIYGRTEDPKP